MEVVKESAVAARGQSASDASLRRIMLGVLAMSFASLLLELSLTRLFSVVLFYHFAFLAISIALLGLGAGGVFAYVLKQRLERWDTNKVGWTACLLNAVLIIVALEVVLHVPVSLRLTWHNFLKLTLIYLVSALPFFFTGLFFSVLFARQTFRISQLYAADLVGGAVACLGIVPLLNGLGGPNTILFAAIAMALSGLVWAETRKARLGALALAGLVSVLTIVNLRANFIDIVFAKGERRDKSWVEFAKWNAISRVEVDNLGGAKVIVIDADASTYIMAQDPKQPWEGSDYQKNLMSAAPSVANVLRPRGEYAIIGPGGGVDVLRAVANGSPSVTGIEINPIIANTIMREKYADWSYGLYSRPDVHIHVNDGRSWIRSAKQKFDVIQMTLVDTWASTAAGAFALSENNLYTVEAFREYFDHLKPDGYIAITRWEFARPREALRVVSQAMRALNGSDLRRYFIVVVDGDLNQDGRPVTVLGKKTPFTPEEQATVLKHLASQPKLHALYLPWPDTGGGAYESRSLAPKDGAREDKGVGANGEGVNATAFRQLIESGNPERFAQTYPFNVSPVYDNAPFFFFTMKPSQILSAGSEKGIDWKVNVGVVVLLMLVVISALAVLTFLIIPLLFSAEARHEAKWMPLIYFIAIGLGYIVVEITLIQRLVLFLGHPIYAMTVVVFLMLLSSGAGSIMSRRLFVEPRKVRMAFGIIIGLIAAYYFGLSPVLHGLIGLPQTAKILIASALIIPLGFVMGMPFPSGLRMLGERGSDNLVEWAWAMNAASSVLGSVLAMSVAIQFGLGATLVGGGLAYVLAWAMTTRVAGDRAGVALPRTSIPHFCISLRIY
jgi:predicted membrane-bound spermidine synthase